MADGSKTDPYTMEEYYDMVEDGTWTGGYVKDDQGRTL